jgi:hypothetical protein
LVASLREKFRNWVNLTTPCVPHAPPRPSGGPRRCLPRKDAATGGSKTAAAARESGTSCSARKSDFGKNGQGRSGGARNGGGAGLRRYGFGSASWIAHVLLALGGALATGAIAWLLISPAASRSFG